MTNVGTRKLEVQIVGIVRDAKHGHVRDAVEATAFRPLAQSTKPSYAFFFYLRTVTPPAQMLPAVRHAMQQFDSTLALAAFRTMDQQIEDDLSNERLVSLLAIAFSMVVMKQLIKVDYRFSPLPILIAIALTALIAAAAGWLASFRILGQKPLEVLRGE